MDIKDLRHMMTSQCYDSPRKNKISKITIHHMAGNLTLEQCARVLNNKEASCNYAIDSSGNVAMLVAEGDRSYCSSSPWNDHQAITIEVANSRAGNPWPVSDKAYAALIELCVDICKRNGITRLNYTGDKNGSLTRHNMFMATACPGPYLQQRFPEIAKTVNDRLSKIQQPAAQPQASKTLYRVQVGAYKEKANALGVEKQLKNKGYSTFIVKVDGLYKVQTGAFAELKNAKALAEKLNKDGFPTYIPGEPVSKPQPLKVGDKVRIKDGTRDLNNGSTFASFVYDTTYKVLDMGSDWVSFGPSAGSYTGRVKKDRVTKV